MMTERLNSCLLFVASVLSLQTDDLARQELMNIRERERERERERDAITTSENILVSLSLVSGIFQTSHHHQCRFPLYLQLTLLSASLSASLSTSTFACSLRVLSPL